MEELTVLLNNIEDTYYDFVTAILNYAGQKQSRLNTVLNYIKNNPDALSSDIIEFVSDQTDFYEDTAFKEAV